MTRPISLATAALALACLMGPLSAQEAAAPEEPAATADQAPAPDAPAADPAADDGLDLGAPAEPAEPAPGEPYVREVFGDWQQRCVRAPEGSDPCQIYQLLLGPEGNAVAEFSIVPLPPGREAAAGVVVVVPLETLLTEQLTLGIDSNQARLYPFDFCNRGGCIARFGLDADQVAQMKRGAAGLLSIVPAVAPDQRMNLTLSLSGFTAAFDATQTPPN